MFTPQNAVLAGQLSGRARRQSARKQILELKEVAHHDAVDPETPVGVKASLMRAYVDLHEIEMAITGQGKPKPVEARNASPKRKARATVSPVRVSTSTQPTPPTEPAP